jgi:hypothetical protein
MGVDELEILNERRRVEVSWTRLTRRRTAYVISQRMLISSIRILPSFVQHLLLKNTGNTVFSAVVDQEMQFEDESPYGTDSDIPKGSHRSGVGDGESLDASERAYPGSDPPLGRGSWSCICRVA